MSNRTVGAKGEDIACSFLLSHGYTIRERNTRSRFGEIDVVAEKDGVIYFIEVKSRTSGYRGKPYDNVHAVKVQHLQRAIQHYISANHLHSRKFQLNVVTVELQPGKTPVVKNYENVPVSAY